jgi:hypothetical protein
VNQAEFRRLEAEAEAHQIDADVERQRSACLVDPRVVRLRTAALAAIDGFDAMAEVDNLPSTFRPMIAELRDAVRGTSLSAGGAA